MKYWIDTEFIEDGATIYLISIGIVSEDNRQYYAINANCDLSKANDFVKAHVLPQLPPKYVNLSDPSISPRMKEESLSWKPKNVIAKEIRTFCDPLLYGIPTFWGYYSDYDWVVFCWIFGSMTDLPSGFPMHCNDIKQLCELLGDPTLPRQRQKEHHALSDALWNKSAWEFLTGIQLTRTLCRLHDRLEGFYRQMPTPESKAAIDQLCKSIEYFCCLFDPSIAESNLKDELLD